MKLLGDRRGISAIEYGLLAGVLGLVLVMVLRAFAQAVTGSLVHYSGAF
jgi:Flp pilus assembly pilin Flp